MLTWMVIYLLGYNTRKEICYIKIIEADIINLIKTLIEIEMFFTIRIVKCTEMDISFINKNSICKQQQ